MDPPHLLLLHLLPLLLLLSGHTCQAECHPEDELDWSNYGYFQTCRSHHIKQALQMTPTHVEVLQCRGACHRSNQGCVPTLTREKEVSVMLGRCGIQTGQCEKECARLVVEEHLECGCDCPEEAKESCSQATHIFNPDSCQCQCRDSAAKQQCLDQGQAWSSQSCQCQCRQPSPCSEGMVFSNVTCSCLPEHQVLHLTEDSRAPRSQNTDPFFSWQLIVILVLLVLIFILLVTIFSLISKLQSAKRRIKAARLAAQTNQNQNSNMYDVYSERPRPAVNNKDVVVKTKSGDKFYSQVYCESPSSGFGSEGSKYSNTDLHADNSASYRSQPPVCNVSPGAESIYHTAETVRLNKKIQNNSAHHVYPGTQNICVPPVPVMASDPIDEAVRLLEHSAAMLQ